MTEQLRIFGWLADYAGCGWYRLMLPLGALNEAGLADCGFSSDVRTVNLAGLDIIVGQRIFKQGVSWKWQQIAHSPNRPMMVYEVDDDLFNLDPGNPSAGLFNDPRVQRNMRANMELADLVTVSTEPLAEQVRKINPRVAVLPNCIPQDLLHWRHGGYDDRLTIGWQGSPTHDQDWAVALDAVTRWFRVAESPRSTVGSVEMHTLGAVPKNFPKLIRHRHTPWMKDIPQFYTTLDWDIALAPLANTLFNRSKSDLRVLEAAMLGIPSIASAVPAYNNSVVHLETGLKVGSPSEWRAALNWLATDADAREAMGRRAREWAATRTIEGNAHLWLEAYEKARSGDVR